MKFNEIISRLTGLSCPIFGISWEASETQRKVARRIITFLEAKRVLYVPSEMELPDHCIHSVIQIRDYLTTELNNVDEKSVLEEYVRAMRSACNKFLQRMNSQENDFIYNAKQWGHWASWTFASALGEMRGTFSVMITQIASAFGLDVEEGLASILPQKD